MMPSAVAAAQLLRAVCSAARRRLPTLTEARAAAPTPPPCLQGAKVLVLGTLGLACPVTRSAMEAAVRAAKQAGGSCASRGSAGGACLPACHSMPGGQGQQTAGRGHTAGRWWHAGLRQGCHCSSECSSEREKEAGAQLGSSMPRRQRVNRPPERPRRAPSSAVRPVCLLPGPAGGLPSVHRRQLAARVLAGRPGSKRGEEGGHQQWRLSLLRAHRTGHRKVPRTPPIPG
jgi:hypothetical protein